MCTGAQEWSGGSFPVIAKSTITVGEPHRAALGFCVTTPEGFEFLPELQAQFDAINAMVRPVVESMRAVQPIADFLHRQSDAMESIRRSFEVALQVAPPPATRAALADLVAQLQPGSLLGSDLAVGKADVQQGLVNLLHDVTDEDTEELEQDIAAIKSSPELTDKLGNIVSRVNWTGVTVTGMSAYTLYLAYNLLMHIADEPVTEHLSAAQDAVVSNRLQVVAIIVALAA